MSADGDLELGERAKPEVRKPGGLQAMGCSVFLGLGQSELSYTSEIPPPNITIRAGIASLLLGASVIAWLLAWAREWKAWCGASREARDSLVSSNSGTAKSRTNKSRVLGKSALSFWSIQDSKRLSRSRGGGEEEEQERGKPRTRSTSTRGAILGGKTRLARGTNLKTLDKMPSLHSLAGLSRRYWQPRFSG